MEPPTRNRWGNEVLMADEQKAPEGQQGEAKANPEAKYTDKDVDEIVSKKFAQWKSKHEAEVAEAQKLAEMNATEKAAYELKKANERIAESSRARSARSSRRPGSTPRTASCPYSSARTPRPPRRRRTGSPRRSPQPSRRPSSAALRASRPQPAESSR